MTDCIPMSYGVYRYRWMKLNGPYNGKTHQLHHLCGMNEPRTGKHCANVDHLVLVTVEENQKMRRHPRCHKPEDWHWWKGYAWPCEGH